VKLEGIHHITCITADAPGNVEFYVGVLGLRLVKKSVNQDDPTVYHLFYADEKGSAGSDITFFEYPGTQPGRAGAGMIHTIVWRVASTAAIDFWEQRLNEHGVETERPNGYLIFENPEGLEHHLAVVETHDEPLTAEHPEIPAEFALQGFHAVHAYTRDPEASRELFEQTLNFEPVDQDEWGVHGEKRGGQYLFHEAPEESGIGGAGTVHHVAWASTMEEHETWRERVVAAGARPTPIIDRYYFRSIYFREPSGVLFEIATLGPGFTADEPLESLGERLALPPDYEPLRDRLEDVLTPLPDPRAAWSTK
jgi:glyoxalase family protein